MKISFFFRLLFLLPFLFNYALSAQNPAAIDQARQFIEDHFQKWELDKKDVEELIVSDHYQSRNGIRHVYFKQHYRGIPIDGAILNVTITPDGRVFTVGTPRLISHLKAKIKTTQPALQAPKALALAAGHTRSPHPVTPVLKEQIDARHFIFEKGTLFGRDIPVQLIYQTDREGQLHLCWSVEIEEKESSESWMFYIDAVNGALLYKSKLTVSCSFGSSPYHNHDRECQPANSPGTSNSNSNSYRVFPFPGESPNHTTHQIVTNPADPIASPFGWHDVNGVNGAEYTTTRGNNVHAFPDHFNQNFPTGGEPDGGSSLDFDFPYNLNASVESNTDAATVNLFYVVNSMHDFYYHYGFDEAAGNFQAMNYSGMGHGGDYILAQSQDSYQTGIVDNANFTAPLDGQPGRMQMYLWSRSVGGGSKYLEVLEPASVAGLYGGIASSDDPQGFGPPPPVTPIMGEVVEALDGKFNPYTTDACEDIINGNELQGKIALVDRGGCTYESKVIRAEAVGAIAVIICNFQDDPVGMQGTTAPDPGIPAIMIGAIDCQTIRQHIGSGLTVTIGQPAVSGPEFVDGDFDNGIITHEFGHGISLRLTGGPANAGCLGNPDFNGNNLPDDTEQMGEGWSDFFALVATVKNGDSGEMRRGIGSFVNRQGTDARGSRRYPYSTDMSINPLTYGDVAGDPETHRLGEVWAAALWDLYWEMVEEHGFDPDLKTGTGGNNKVIELVIEALKMQPCQPGFVEGREAILEADRALNGGANECLIWRVFARRGIGYHADQGDPLDPGDQVENFEPLPICIPELKIAKEVTPTLEAGERIDVQVVVANHKPGSVTNVTVTEELVDGLNFVNGSANYPATEQGDLVVFELGDLDSMQEIELTYQLQTSPGQASTSLLLLDCESTAAWFTEEPEDNNFNKWINDNQIVYNGSKSWRVRAIEAESRQSVFMQDPFTVSGQRPVVRFFHSHLTEGGQDAGIVQIGTDVEAEEWMGLADAFLREPYTGPVNYLTFVIPNLDGFSGDSEGFKASYIDLEAYKGQDIRLRFNFATNEGNGLNAPQDGFWAFDDVEFLDLFNYDTEVVVTSGEGDEARARAGNLGTVVLGEDTPVKELDPSTLKVKFFPNPAEGFVYLALQSETPQKIGIRLLTLDGREVFRQTAQSHHATQTLQLDLKGVAPGFYLAEVATDQGMVMEKLVIGPAD